MVIGNIQLFCFLVLAVSGIFTSGIMVEVF